MVPPSSQSSLVNVLSPLPETPKAECRVSDSWLGGMAVRLAEGPVTLPVPSMREQQQAQGDGFWEAATAGSSCAQR